MKFHEVDPAEGGRVLVLGPAAQSDILTLDLKRQVSDIVLTQRQAQQFRIRGQNRNDHRRRRPQTGTRRRIRPCRDFQRQGLATIEIPHHAVVDTLVQIQQTVVIIGGRCGPTENFLPVIGLETHALLLPRLDGAEGTEADGRIQYRSSIEVAIGGHITATPGEPQPQGRFGSNAHDYAPFTVSCS
ncbi:MAG: hypothetical protein U5K56_05470 [Halioglobus sp.]|nr:hypothetical protein [Halioglobus sp.]